MYRIVVVPEQLRALSARLQQAATELDALGSRIGGAYGGLDWETRYKAGVEGQVGDARRRAAALAQQAEAMARYLATKAQAFTDADAAAAGAVLAVSAGWQTWQANYQAALPTLTQVRNSSWWDQVQRSGWNTRFSEWERLRQEIELQDRLGATDPLARLRTLDAEIEQLERERAHLHRQATNWLNQILPDGSWKLDSDGMPWRVRADDYEDRVVALDQEIHRLKALRETYAQYALLDDLIKQGIPEDGPSKERALYGCTYYAAARRNVDSWRSWGHGKDWPQNARDAGWEVGSTPLKGALVSFEAGSGYFDESTHAWRHLDARYGHVAYVEEVDWSRSDVVRIRISEGNYVGDAGGPGPGSVRKDIWITVNKDALTKGDVTFIYGPGRLPPDMQMYLA